MDTHANATPNMVGNGNPNQEDKKRPASERWDETIGDFWEYKLRHPMTLYRLVGILGIPLILFLGYLTISFTLQYFSKPKPVEPIYVKIEGIRQLGRLHLVKHHYESVIPITRNKMDRHDAIKKQRLQFLLKAPVEISGYIDLSQMTISMVEGKDSLVDIHIPPAQASDPYLDFSKTEEFLVDGKVRFFGNYIEFINHERAYYDIVRGLNESKERVKDRAVGSGLLDQTTDKAKMFLRNFVNNLGYRANIVVDSTLQS